MDELMIELGVSNAKAARYFGADRHTITRWRAGDKAPMHVMRQLRYLIACQNALIAMRKA